MINNIEEELQKVEILLTEKIVTNKFASGRMIELIKKLEAEFQNHITILAPVLKHHYENAKKGISDLGNFIDNSSKIISLNSQLMQMRLKNEAEVFKGRPPIFSDEEIKKVEEELWKENEVQDNTKTQPIPVTTNYLDEAQNLLNRHYQTPLKKIKKTKIWYSLFNIGFATLKFTLFILAIFLSHHFSNFLTCKFGIDSLFSEIIVATIFVFSIDKLTECLKDSYFWKISYCIFDKVKKQFLELRIIEPDFQKYKTSL